MSVAVTSSPAGRSVQGTRSAPYRRLGRCREPGRHATVGSLAWRAMIPDRFAPVLDELRPLAQRFEAAGHRLYLVGGTVRDLLVDAGRDDFDLDLTTDARPDEIKACLGRVGATRSGPRVSGSARSAPSSASAPTRSRRSGPSRTPTTPASRTSPTPTTSRPISAAATSRSTRWRSSSRVGRRRRSSTLTAAPSTWCRRCCARHSAPTSASATTRCACCGRPGSSPGSTWTPTETLVAAVEAMASRLEIVSAERIRDEFDKLITRRPSVRRGCGSSTTPASPTSSCPSCRRCGSSTIRSTVTRTSCQPHDRRRRERAPARRAAGGPAGVRLPDRSGWRRCSTTSASRAPVATSRARAPRSTTTTRSARA